VASRPAGAPGASAIENGSSRLGRPGLRALRARLGLRELGPVRITVALAAVAGALLAAWAQWQPERSANTSQQALALLAHDPRSALGAAQTAVSDDPLSAQALFTLSTVEQATGRPALARATLQRSVRLQPSNPQTWLTLGEYDVASNPRAAVDELVAAIYLNPESIAPEAIAQGNPEAIAIQNYYVQAVSAAAALAKPAATATKRSNRRSSRRGRSRAHSGARP
jgi:hypothetical protein